MFWFFKKKQVNSREVKAFDSALKAIKLFMVLSEWEKAKKALSEIGFKEKESLKEALTREIREEAGIEIDIIKDISFDEDYEPNKHGVMTHYLFITYLANYVSGKVKADDDIDSLKWVHKKDVKNLELCKPSINLFTKLGYL